MAEIISQDPHKVFIHYCTHAHTYTITISSCYAHTHETRGTWQKTHQLDRLLTMDETSRRHKTHSRLSLTAAHTHTHTHHNFKLLRSHSRNTGYLTKDASSWQAADNGRNIQTAQDPLKAFTHYCTHAHTYTITISSRYVHTHETRGTWRKTHHLDRLLTTDETSRQHKTHSRLSLTTAHTHTHTQSQFQAVTLTLTKHGVPDERRIILTGCWQRTKHPDSTRPT